VNLLAVHAFPSARRSQIDLVPSDAAAFLAAGHKPRNLKVSKPKTGVLDRGDDRVGAMAQLLARLGAARNQRDRDECNPHGHGRYGALLW